VSHRAADQCGCNVVKEAGEHEDHDQQNEPAFPVTRQVLGQDHRHMAFLEMPRKQGKTHQQTEEVGQNDPFMTKMADESGEAVACLEAGKDQLVQGDRDHAGQADIERVVVEQRDAQQRQREKDEIERDRSYGDQLTGMRRGSHQGK